MTSLRRAFWARFSKATRALGVPISSTIAATAGRGVNEETNHDLQRDTQRLW